VLRALVADADDASWRQGVLGAAHRRDVVKIDSLATSAQADGLIGRDRAEAHRSLPRMRGGREVISRGRELAGPVAAEAFDGLEATIDLLERAGMGDAVSVDMGLTRDFDYYSGLVLEAYAPGLGLPVGGGGRYDTVLEAFGPARPAAGFALGIERLHIALAEQGRLPATRGLDAVLGGATPEACFVAAAALRRAGWRVSLASQTPRAELPASALQALASTALWADGPSLGLLAPDGSVASAYDLDDPPAPPAAGEVVL
jgi:ATP phosphoribosyltransferase regulatory subunit